MIGALVWLLWALLILLFLRRTVFAAAALLPPRDAGDSDALPSLAILSALRNEESDVGDLLAAIDALDYPEDRVAVVLVDDGSTDRTGPLITAWASQKPNRRALRLETNRGKAPALRAGAEAAPPSTLLVVFDADVRPRRDFLRRLVRRFDDSTLGAACGYMEPRPRTATPVAAYACLEYWVNQLVTMASKDRLGWNPPLLGGTTAYRRDALEAVGGFPTTRVFSEDTELSLALANAGWRTGFCREAVARFSPATSLRHFRNQRARWSSGLLASGRHARGLEAVATASGYLDRLVLVAALAGVAAGWMHPVAILVYLLPIAFSVLVAIWSARPPVSLLGLLAVALVPMFLIDVATSLTAAGRALVGRRPGWLSRRAADAPKR